MNGIGRWTFVLGLGLICIGSPGCAKKKKSITESSDPAPEKVQYPQCVLAPAAEADMGAVNLGETSEMTLAISNGNGASGPENLFAYEFLLPGSIEDCGAFSIPEASRKGILGPGGSADVSVSFEPTAAKQYQCNPLLLSQKVVSGVPQSAQITNACASPLTWGGVGIPQWEDCNTEAHYSDLNGIYGTFSFLFAVGDGGTVLRKESGSCQWTRVDIGAPFPTNSLDLRDVWLWDNLFLGQLELWTVGERETPGGAFGDAWGTIFRFNGADWDIRRDGWLIQYESVWGSNQDDVWFGGVGIATDFPNARHWDGSTLDSLQIHSGWSNVAGLHGTSPANVWAVFDQPYQSVFHYDGTSWTDQTQPFMDKPLFDVWAGSNGHIYAVGAEGAIYHFDGTSWIDESIESETNDFYGVWVNGLNNGVVVVGEHGVVYVSDGIQWVEASLRHLREVEGLTDVWGWATDVDDWVIYAVGEEGRILRLKATL